MQTTATGPSGIATTRITGAARMRSDRLAALSGLIFVALAVGQNIVRAATAAPNDARSPSIVAHFVDHRDAELVLAATVVGGAFALALFVGHLWTRLARGAERSWAQTGIIGVMGIFAIFPLLVACEMALLVITGRPSAGSDAVETLWALHNAVFTVNMAALGVATLGLSVAAVRCHRSARGMPADSGSALRTSDRSRERQADLRALRTGLPRMVECRRRDVGPTPSHARGRGHLNANHCNHGRANRRTNVSAVSATSRQP